MNKKSFVLKQELLNFKITLPLPKLDMVGSRLVSNRLIFPDYIQVDIQLATFLLLSDIRQLSIEEKARNYW